MTQVQGVSIHVNGVVQGVGFRPFVFGLAKKCQLKGWVRNTSAGVDILVDGTQESINTFLDALKNHPPPLATIDSIDIQSCEPGGFTEFRIIKSEFLINAYQPISPDVSICPDCLRELYDPKDHRYLYPFINCTNCGPRFTIIEDIPYDRPNTTMAPFEMCDYCSKEYHDPLNRRFHAQPVACFDCGPNVWLESSQSAAITAKGNDAIRQARELLSRGKIIAVKGLGGFHLACDAMNRKAVAELRRRKLRVDKPFALMMPDIREIERQCIVNTSEREYLESRERPILLLNKRKDTTIAQEVAPGQSTFGVMLPYTPLHYLLFNQNEGNAVTPLKFSALVMTSGNIREEPIATDNLEAKARLSSLADSFLLHNRDVKTRCDDSVIRITKKRSNTYPIRRSRGYAPFPTHIPFRSIPILAVGGELKNTFCLTRDYYAFISHHIGDMENYETFRAFEDGITHYERLFRIHPELIAYDLHPNYMATRYALTRSEKEGLQAIGVQHHHAHIASCMAENHLKGKDPVIGVSFDGTGYGDDGTIWGGEFLLSQYSGYQRIGYLKPFPLPGGDSAIKEPWRVALACLKSCNIDWEDHLPPVKFANIKNRTNTFKTLDVLRKQIEAGLNTPLCSSMGRLFDCVASLVGIRQVVNYEAQAAIELETLVNPDESGAYQFSYIVGPNQTRIVDPTPVFGEIISDIEANVDISTIAARFHNAITDMIRDICTAIRSNYGLDTIVLSGGVWQNMILLSNTISCLEKVGFKVVTHRYVPTNDGGLSLGQAIIALQSQS